jgi:Uma2 family endonuclease
MSVSTVTPAPPAPAPPGAGLSQPRKWWSTAEFDELVRKGFLREGSHAFLWGGEIITPMPENQPHVNATMVLFGLLSARLPAAEWTVNLDKPIEIRDGYKPQPDLLVLTGPRSRYRVATPRAADAALVVEVSDTSYHDDAGEFLREYEAARIPVYWIVNIPARRVEVYRLQGPDRVAYAPPELFSLDARVPLSLDRDGAVTEFDPIPVAEVLADSLEGGA